MPDSPLQCMAPGFGQWGRSPPEPEGKQECSACFWLSTFSPSLPPLSSYLQLPGQKGGEYEARAVTELHRGGEKVGLKVSGVAGGSGDTHDLPPHQPVDQRGLSHIGET